jgi:hypothetical protein
MNIQYRNFKAMCACVYVHAYVCVLKVGTLCNNLWYASDILQISVNETGSILSS